MVNYAIAFTWDAAKQLHNKGIVTSADLARHLLENHAIAGLSGDAFGMPETELALRLSTSYLDFASESGSQRLLDLYGPGVSEAEFMSIEHHPNTHGCIQAFSSFIQSL